jgi:hypothetical protein
MALMKKTAADALFDKWLRQWASREHVERLEKVIEEFVPNWSLGPVVRALQTLRGFDLIVRRHLRHGGQLFNGAKRSRIPVIVAGQVGSRRFRHQRRREPERPTWPNPVRSHGNLLHGTVPSVLWRLMPERRAVPHIIFDAVVMLVSTKESA